MIRCLGAAIVVTLAAGCSGAASDEGYSVLARWIERAGDANGSVCYDTGVWGSGGAKMDPASRVLIDIAPGGHGPTGAVRLTVMHLVVGRGYDVIVDRMYDETFGRMQAQDQLTVDADGHHWDIIVTGVDGHCPGATIAGADG